MQYTDQTDISRMRIFDDELMREAMRIGKEHQVQMQELPWKDERGFLVPSPTPRNIDVNQVGR